MARAALRWTARTYVLAPKKAYHLVCRPGDAELWRAQLEDAGLDAEVKKGVKIQVRVEHDILREHRGLLDVLISATVKQSRA